jgi:hypothetical protein
MDLDELTDFDDWTDVRLSLAPWTLAHDAHRSLVLMRSEQGVHMYEPPNAWRARHRRELHRLGFRSQPAPRGGRMWQWTVPAHVVKAEVNADFDVSSNSITVVPVIARLRRIIVTDRLVLDRALVVLRDVFRLQPADVSIVVPLDESDGYDEEDWAEAQ